MYYLSTWKEVLNGKKKLVLGKIQTEYMYAPFKNGWSESCSLKIIAPRGNKKEEREKIYIVCKQTNYCLICNQLFLWIQPQDTIDGKVDNNMVSWSINYELKLAMLTWYTNLMQTYPTCWIAHWMTPLYRLQTIWKVQVSYSHKKK